MNVRQKYAAEAYRLPKEFNAEIPGFALHEKYKESFHLITPATPATIPPNKIVEIEKEAPILTNAN